VRRVTVQAETRGTVIVNITATNHPGETSERDLEGKAKRENAVYKERKR